MRISDLSSDVCSSDLTILAAFASLGLPGLAGFVAEFQIFAGTFAVWPWLAGIGILGILITAALFLHMLQQLFFGKIPSRWRDFTDLRGAEVAVLVVLLLLVVVIGIYPAWLLSVVEAGTAAVVGRSEEHTSELQSLMRKSYAVFCLKKKTTRRHVHVLH